MHKNMIIMGGGMITTTGMHGLKFPIFRPKYRISVTTEAKSIMENRLKEKSLKNRKFRRYFADI